MSDDPEFEEQMARAREIMREYRDALRQMAGIDHEGLAAHKRERLAKQQADAFKAALTRPLKSRAQPPDRPRQV